MCELAVYAVLDMVGRSLVIGVCCCVRVSVCVSLGVSTCVKN